MKRVLTGILGLTFMVAMLASPIAEAKRVRTAAEEGVKSDARAVEADAKRTKDSAVSDAKSQTRRGTDKVRSEKDEAKRGANDAVRGTDRAIDNAVRGR